MMILLKELNVNVNALCISSTLKSISLSSRAISAVAELVIFVQSCHLVARALINDLLTYLIIIVQTLSNGGKEEQFSSDHCGEKG